MGVPRLGGALDKKRFGALCSNLRSFGSKCTVLKKVLATLSGLFSAPPLILRPGRCAPFSPLVTSLVVIESASPQEMVSTLRWIAVF